MQKQIWALGGLARALPWKQAMPTAPQLQIPPAPSPPPRPQEVALLPSFYSAGHAAAGGPGGRGDGAYDGGGGRPIRRHGSPSSFLAAPRPQPVPPEPLHPPQLVRQTNSSRGARHALPSPRVAARAARLGAGGGGTHGVRGASGDLTVRGPGFPPDIRPPRAPLAPLILPPEVTPVDSPQLGCLEPPRAAGLGAVADALGVTLRCGAVRALLTLTGPLTAV